MDTGELAPSRVVSPELVLVDPELAAEARAALPDRPWPQVPRIELESAAPPRRRPPFAGLLAGAIAAALLVALSVLPNPDRPTFAAPAGEVSIRPQQQPPPVTRPRVVRPKRHVTTARIEPRARSRPRPVRVTTPVITQQVEPQTAAPPRPRPTPQSPQTRQTPPTRRPAPIRLTPGPSFGWPSHPGALYYHVRFLRNGETIYEAQTRVPRVRVPVRIRFTPGEYRWIVRPAIPSDSSTRLGSPIVDSTFRVDGD